MIRYDRDKWQRVKKNSCHQTENDEWMNALEELDIWDEGVLVLVSSYDGVG